MPAVMKTYGATVSAAGPEEAPGTFVALVSVFGNTDSYGDIVEAGAFTNTLKEWAAKDAPIPVVWSHQFGDPDNILGEYIEAEETAEGLLLKGILDLDHPKAERIYKLMERKLITEFSFSGEIREYALIEDDDEESWWPGLAIKDVALWEAGPCFKGANPATELISVKSADLTGPLARRIQAGKAASPEPDMQRSAADNPAPDTIDLVTTVDISPSVERISAATTQVLAQLALAQIH